MTYTSKRTIVPPVVGNPGLWLAVGVLGIILVFVGMGKMSAWATYVGFLIAFVGAIRAEAEEELYAE